MAQPEDRAFYSVSQAARLLGVSPSTVWRWIEAKKLPAYRVGARKIRIKKDDLRTVVTPARCEEPVLASTERHRSVPPTEDELARRQEVVARILANQEGRSIAPLTTADLIRQVREEREERHRSWLGLDRSS